MAREEVIHLGGEGSGRSAGAKTVRARLFAVDADRLKRIDSHIDYFGGGGAGSRARQAGCPRGDRPPSRPRLG